MSSSSPLIRLLHWGPLTSLAIVGSLTFATGKSGTNYLWIHLFHITMSLCLYNMWCATFIGPGYQEADQDQQQATDKKDGCKATNNELLTKHSTSRTSNRFCRRCDRTVLGKHHHCPWINNCVGRNNEVYFIRFLMFAGAVTLQASSHMMLDLFEQDVDIMNDLFEIFNLALSVGALVAVSFLLYTH